MPKHSTNTEKEYSTYETVEYYDRKTVARLKRYLPNHPCLRCRNFLDEYGLPKCSRKNCGKWNEFNRQFFDNNPKIDELRKKAKR